MASEDSSANTLKLFTHAEVALNNTADKLWTIIHHNVYDLTDFLVKHPGGIELLLDQGGRDATEPFEDVGHSTDARKMMEPYKIGEIVEEERKQSNAKGSPDPLTDSKNQDSSFCVVM
ncbi:PREDICTED: cytochrome b5-like isoform X2 [Ceratosolen solmsi marchali]|uniref:Cytochrome b5 n=1 Tax=Ceratosolen solmsi marchali TaxID=326594 RepID=A0AAJ6YWX4_9HYME|nr:PREDICTED: cytochrome b5-like isoform X2 [Ceratosolen solmsi marchali]